MAKVEKLRWPGVVTWMVVAGALLVALAGICGAWEYWQHRSELRAVGTVRLLESTLAPDGSVLVVEHVRFSPTSDKAVEFLLTPSPFLPPVKTGDAVPVLYRADNPQAAELGTALHMYPLAILLGLVGIVLFDAGVGLWMFVRRGGTARVALSIKNLRESVR